MKKLNELPQAFYGVIQGGKVVMLPDEDGQWLNKTSVAEAFRELERRAEAAEVKLAELEKQEPVAMRYRWAPPHMKMPDGSQFYGEWKMVADPEIANPGKDYERVNLYTQPAPAVDLAELVPDELTPKQASRSYGGEVVGYRDGFNACRDAILRNIAQADRDKFFKFLKDTSAIVDSWPDWKKQGSDVGKFLNPSPSAEVVDDSCPKGSVHEWVHHAPCYNPDYEECNKCGQRKECSENE